MRQWCAGIVFGFFFLSGLFRSSVSAAEMSVYNVSIEMRAELDDETIRELVARSVEDCLRAHRIVIRSVTVERQDEPIDELPTKAVEIQRGDLKLFDPLLADVRWPHLSVSIHDYSGRSGSVTATNIGAWLTTPYAGSLTDGAWQFGVQGAVYSIFDMSSDSYDLVNSDYYVAFPTVTFRRDDLAVMGRFFHESSHLGDEYILNNAITPEERLNLSYEGIDVFVSRYFDIRGENTIRIYGGPEYLVRTDPNWFGDWSVQYGVEYRHPTLKPADNYWLGMRFLPVAGVDVKHREWTDWDLDVSVRAGIEITDFMKRRLNHRYQFLLEYYNGHSPDGQFFQEEIEFYGFGFHAHLF